MDIAVLGIDLGKNSCSVVGLDGSGKVILRRRMQRKTIMVLASKLSPCVVAMEACCGAHHLGRILSAQGQTLRLMSPEYVRPYVKAQKNDERDAEAIAEAATRPTMRFVTLKSQEQLDMQTLHRARDRVVRERTSLMNQLRAVLLERGIIVPKGRAKLRLWLTKILAGRPTQPRRRACDTVFSRDNRRAARPARTGLRSTAAARQHRPSIALMMACHFLTGTVSQIVGRLAFRSTLHGVVFPYSTLF